MREGSHGKLYAWLVRVHDVVGQILSRPCPVVLRRQERWTKASFAESLCLTCGEGVSAEYDSKHGLEFAMAGCERRECFPARRC